MIAKLIQILPAAKLKERKAQRALVDCISPYLFTICRRYAVNTEDAKDILQDALILIFKNIEKFDSDPKGFKPWISKITVNVALSRFRKSYNVNEWYPGELILHPYQEAKILDQLQAEDILELINRLPVLQKQVFNLFIVDGYSHAEISEMLGIKLSHSRTVLTRARKRIQELIFEQKKVRL